MRNFVAVNSSKTFSSFSLIALRQEIENSGESSAVASITDHIQAKRCGCKVNNPQGSCCLSNIKSFFNPLVISLSKGKTYRYIANSGKIKVSLLS